MLLTPRINCWYQNWTQGPQDNAVGGGICNQAWWPEFSPRAHTLEGEGGGGEKWLPQLTSDLHMPHHDMYHPDTHKMIFLHKYLKIGLVAHPWNSSNQEAEAGGSHGETQSQKN